MAKHKNRRPEQKRGNSKSAAFKVQKPQKNPKKTASKRGNAVQPRHNVFPYGKYDRILLVGEGDFSFAASLLEHHKCKHITATCFDSAEEVDQKYPQAKETIARLTERGQRVLYGVDATKLSQKTVRRPPPPPARRESTFDEEGGEYDSNDEDALDEDENVQQVGQDGNTTQQGPRGWDMIAFNFPHVGGKSTDVNRQVRHNQSLLLSFFKAAQPLLTPPCPTHPAGGVVLVTLFEGEPYALWNVKELARNAGLRNERSWKFDWGAYPGYKHARTLGNIDGGGGWKGEERAARSYAFVGKDAPRDVGLFEGPPGATSKRKREASSDEGEED